MWRAGIDIGGTFTDLVFLNEESGELKVVKVLTTPKEPTEGVMNGIRKSGISLNEMSMIVHATTLGTNMFLGQEGLTPPKVALITTKGFRDVLELGRQRRPELYNLFFEKPAPLIKRRDRYEVSERIGPKGEIIEPLDEREVIKLIDELCSRYEVIAVSLINSYVNDIHERRIKQIIKERCPGIDVVISSEVNPEHKEYERTSTTAVNAFLKKLVSTYMRKLQRRLREEGFEGNLLIMQSSGGVSKVENAVERPAAFIESGPAAGAVAVAYYSRVLNLEKVIGFDMGGTTAKASTIVGGEPSVTTEYEVGGKIHAGRLVKGSGYPVRFPFIDLAEVSAGGGTIAWVDEGGALRVGPISAGADPGPACYNKGGKRATITDANLLLGRLGDTLAGGFKLHKELATKAVKEIADQVGLSVEETSLGIIKIANTVMAKALRIVTVERGHDPREFTMFVFGGAGPLHGVDLARELEVYRVLVPKHPGVFSAMGLLLTDYRVDRVKGLIKLLEEVDESEIESVFAEMEEDAKKELEVSGVTAIKTLDLRYKGQAYEINVPWTGSINEAQLAFHAKHEALYGYSSPDEPVELVNLRLALIGTLPKPELKAEREREHKPFKEGVRKVYFEDLGWVEVPLFKREKLRPGASREGPAIIEEYDSSTLVPPDYWFKVDGFGNLVIWR